ncbi:MAG: glycosyltransferase [Hungatella sp.]|nr:glycosyltransferase [Hungatella sp.]
MEVSIIVPVHNSEKYLKECIQSALIQTFNSIEILCIDGGSTDASYQIINELQQADNRIRCFQDSNTSYGHKINVGIQEAKGKYIAILESDDKMCPEMIEMLYNIAKVYDADIIDADFYEVFCHSGKDFTNSVKKYDTNSYGKLIREFNSEDNDAIVKGIWTALYKKEFLIENNICLNESKGAAYQDFSFLFLTSLFSKITYHVMSPLYQYRIDNVGSSVKDDSKIFEIIGECDFLKCNLAKRNVTDKEIWRLYYIKKYEAFYWNYCRLSPKSRYVFLERYMEELMSDIEKGYIKRENEDMEMYKYTFLLLDNKKEFVSKVTERDSRLSLNQICSILDLCQHKKLVIFGAGQWGRKILSVLLQNKSDVQGVCDNSVILQGTVESGFEIMTAEYAIKKFPNACFLIANRKNRDEMKKQLIKNGVEERNIFSVT